MNTGIMSVWYNTHQLSAGGVTLEENVNRRYLAVYSDADATVEFENGHTLHLPAGTPWAPMTSPTNKLVIKSAGAGLVMEA